MYFETVYSAIEYSVSIHIKTYMSCLILTNHDINQNEVICYVKVPYIRKCMKNKINLN